MVRAWLQLRGSLALLLVLSGCSGEAPGDDMAACPAVASLFNASLDSGTLAIGSGQALAIAGLHFEEGGPVKCSATLLGRGFGVSAAHCRVVPLVQLRVGDEPLVVNIEWLAAHPRLDVALFRLDRSAAAAASAIEPIPLFAGAIDDDLVGEQLTLAGLGQTETGASGELRFVQERVTQINEDEIWVDGMGETGACGGDSGGPLLVRDAEGELRIAGVLDRGSDNCLGVDVYSRADQVRDWVETITAAEGERWPEIACAPPP